MELIKSILKNRTSKFLLYTFIPVVISTVAVYLIDISNISWLRMVWNYFLAVIPVYMALFVEHFSKGNKKISEFIFMLLWLLFFPNSIYMLTDYKYLSYFDFDLWKNYTDVSYNLVPWILLANLVISVTLGVIAGLISLEKIHNLLKNKFSQIYCWGIIVGISILSSFGVYIGRYARLNSWDIVNPVKIIIKSLQVITPFALIFIGIFTGLTLLLYGVYRYLIYHYKKA